MNDFSLLMGESDQLVRSILREVELFQAEMPDWAHSDEAYDWLPCSLAALAHDLRALIEDSMQLARIAQAESDSLDVVIGLSARRNLAGQVARLRHLLESWKGFLS